METKARNSKSKTLAKKAWSIVRQMLAMTKKGTSKGNLLMALNLFLKKGNQLANKAINGLILHHNSLICRSNNPSNHFFSPSNLDYEFSCNNSPAVGPYLIHMAHHHRPKPKSRSSYHIEDPIANQVLEMMTSSDGPTRSPLGTGMEYYFLPGFGNGRSPVARQLRVTDSPFPLKDGKGNLEDLEEDVKVNKAADEFINKFYNNLRMQKSPLQSPLPHAGSLKYTPS